MNKRTKREEYERVFNCFDENKDGKLSAGEMRRSWEAIRSGKPTLEEAMEPRDAEGKTTKVKQRLEEADEDGWLDFEEFVRLVEEGEEKEKERDLKKAFEMYEMEEGSGGITARSLKTTLSSLGYSPTLQQSHLMISHFDLNGDGIISFDEFRAMMQ